MSNLLKDAAQFAALAHADQRRKYEGGPYILHPLRVAGRVALHDEYTEVTGAAAWLHDVVEDTKFTGEEIFNRFGLDVATLVFWLTNEKAPQLNRESRKLMQRDRMGSAPREAKIIKCCDRLDNLQDLPRNDFRKLYASETVQLCDAMTASTPDFSMHPALMALRATAMIQAMG